MTTHLRPHKHSEHKDDPALFCRVYELVRGASTLAPDEVIEWKRARPGVFQRLSEQSITCPVCGRTSFNPNDVAQRYCGFCHRFLDDPAPAR